MGNTMAGAKEFWVPSDLALEILGFNKNILEKRISAGYIKKEIKSDIELVEISGEIDRFGLSEEVAREKLKDYLDKDHGETVGSITPPEPVSPSVNKPAKSVSKIDLDAPIAEPVETTAKAPKITIPDYSPFFNQIAESLIDIKKSTLSLPDSVGAQINAMSKGSSEGKGVEELIPRIDALFQEVSRLAPIEIKNTEYQKEIDKLRVKLEQSNAEIVKITSTSNQVMDELERTQKNHQGELENLRNLIKTEISDLGSFKPQKSGGAVLATLFSFVALLGVGFLIYEFFTPTFTVLKSQNEKINPLTVADIKGVVQKEMENLEQKQKTLLDGSIEQLKTGQTEVLKDLNATFTSLFDQQKDVNGKLFNGILGKQNELKEKLSTDYLDKMKSIEKEISDLQGLIKNTLETAVMVKPGSLKVIKDSSE